MAEPTSGLAAFSGLMEGLARGLELHNERKRQKALDKAQEISTNALREHQKQMDAIAMGREQRLSDEFDSRAALKKELADLNRQIAGEKDATKRLELSQQAWQKSMQLAQPYSDSPGANVDISKFFQQGMPQPPAPGSAPQGQPGALPTQGSVQPQPNPIVQAAQAPAMSGLGSGKLPSPIQTPQIGPIGQPPTALPGQSPPPGIPANFVQGAPGTWTPPGGQGTGFNPYSPPSPNSPLGQKAAANAAAIDQKRSTIPVNEARAKVLTQDEMLKNIQTQTARELASSKISKIQAETVNEQARHELILAQTDHMKAMSELVASEKKLTDQKTKFEPIRLQLEKARVAVEKELAENPRLNKNDQWLATQNRELGQAMSSIIAKQEPFIKNINVARGKVAAYEQILNNPPSATPPEIDPSNTKPYTDWQKQKASYDYAKAHIDSIKDDIKENEQLNRQLEAEKASVTSTLTKLGMDMLHNGKPDPGRQKAVEAAAAADAKKKADEAKKHLRKKPDVPSGGVAPAAVKDVKKMSDSELFDSLRP